MKTRLLRIPIAISLAAAAFLAAPASSADEPSFYQNRGVAGAVRQLKRAETGVRILHTGAHPDDEDSALLAYLSLGEGARAWYLSLTRGEGGQNLIGPELSEGLGIIRTSELLAAREIDGANQLFGRMIDFGFSKTAEEALSMWGRDEVVKDIVRAIRMTRPHIVISRFSGTPSDGHGQHQAAGIGTREAIDAAADPNRYSDLGLPPWRVQKFYVESFDRSSATTLEIDTSVYDPWFGRSFSAVGARGRSQHRSQDMGMPEFEVWRPSFLALQLPAAEGLESRIDEGLQLTRPKEWDNLERSLVTPIGSPQEIADATSAILKQWESKSALGRMRDQDAESFADVIQACASGLGIRLEAFASGPDLPLGESVEVICTAYFPPESALRKMRWSIDAAQGLRVSEGPASPTPPKQGVETRAFKLSAEFNAEPSAPYFLRRPPKGHLYDWAGTKYAALPFERPAAVARFEAEFDGQTLVLEAPVEYRRADPAFGEIRSDLTVLPPVSISFSPDPCLLNLPQEKISVRVRAENLTGGEFRDRLVVFDPSNPESAAAEIEVALASKERREFELAFAPPATVRRHQNYAARWAGQQGNAKTAFTVNRIDYRHIRPRSYARPASLQIHLMNVAIPHGLKIGYVSGSGDGVAESLAQLGVEIRQLDPSSLEKADLSAFDAIVLGIRAYEVRNDLIANNQRLLDYVRDGGTLIVQYHKYDTFDSRLAPHSFNTAGSNQGRFRGPHERVTDEAAPVTILAPEHPVFHSPNEITQRDFEGWIQERGLYFWLNWDERYTPLLASADPGEEPKKGGLLMAKAGKGNYIYTGYAFFRQLPAGVEGAAKLFVNLVSLGKKEPPVR